MSYSNRNLNSRVKIVDHFDDIINQIDIKTEILLQDQSLKEAKRNKLKKRLKK